MVYFTCNHCGESLKKPTVEKHYNTKCRSNQMSLTCVDCHKDFYGNEYDVHTKCISEAERYSGKGYVAKASLNKGQRKQEAWLEIVRSIQAKANTFNGGVKEIINTIGERDNVPRKKNPFINFLKNVGRRFQQRDVEEAWSLLEEAMKEQQQLQQPSVKQQNGKEDPATNGTTAVNGLTEPDTKSKKRKHEDGEEQPTKKSKTEITSTEEPADTFQWDETIKNILISKDNLLKLNKLKKKVIKKYKTFYELDQVSDKFDKKFNKNLKRLGFKVENDYVKLGA
jgi:cell growth-regulating nucleolar protein